MSFGRKVEVTVGDGGDGMSLFGKHLLNIAFLTEPAEIISDEMARLAAGTGNDDDARLVRLLGEGFDCAGVAFRTREHHVETRCGGQWFRR